MDPVVARSLEDQSWTLEGNARKVERSGRDIGTAHGGGSDQNNPNRADMDGECDMARACLRAAPSEANQRLTISMPGSSSGRVALAVRHVSPP